MYRHRSKLPDDNSAYATLEYWDKRYTERKEEKRYDWFQKWDDLQEVLKPLIDPSNSILMLGCGNSSLSEDMYNAGFKSITNIDFSPTIIEQMQRECGELMPEMKWITMNVLDMSALQESSFEIVLEKGTMDALMCEKGDVWELDPKVAADCHKMCTQVSRVLKPGGKFIQITFSQPHFRRNVMQKDEYNWEYKAITIGTGFHYYVYVMTKM